MPATKKTIYLARHAKSSWTSLAKRDFDRPLSQRGLKDASLIGMHMDNLNWQPDTIISSPALRAKETCHLLSESIRFPANKIIWNNDIYAAYTVTLVHIINALPEYQQSVMLVGHNPSMEEFLAHLCGEDVWQDYAQTNGKLLTTGNIAKISFSGSWKNLTMGQASLARLLRPKELP